MLKLCSIIERRAHNKVGYSIRIWCWVLRLLPENAGKIAALQAQGRLMLASVERCQGSSGGGKPLLSGRARKAGGTEFDGRAGALSALNEAY